MQPFDPAIASVWPKVRRPAAAVALAGGLLAAALWSLAAGSFTPDGQPTGWVSRPAVSSTDLRSNNEVVYRADYRAGVWTGTVRANYISAEGDIQYESPWPYFDTASVLAATSWDSGRRIVTRKPNGTNVPFRWASLDATQQAALGTATTGPVLLEYVRGNRSNEAPNGTKLRARESVQGDIQHSTLVYWTHLGGEKRLYVGGNDGMLHAFNATSGAEVFAYVPSMVISRLPRLATDPYVHSLFVDGGLVAADVRLGDSVRTLLAGTLGGGGKGLFLLDVTNPTPADEAAAAAAIKWEITPASSGFANLGYTYAAPRLARLNNGSAAVVVGNGYLNSGTGRASLFIVDADAGALIREIDTGSGSTGSPNGLSTATLVDSNLDGKADYAYAGDIDGNLWRFDLTASSSGSWSVSKLLTTSPQQAITTAPVVANHPRGGRMVLFGTGRTLAAADVTDSAGHYAYGFWDGAPAANTTWIDQTITEVTANGQRLRSVSANQPNWASGGHTGWRLALPAGERVVGEGQFVSDDRFYFTTTNPTVDAATDGEADGSNWLMEVNFLSGGRPASAIFDINGDGRIDSGDNVGGAVIVGKYLGAGVSSQAVLTDLTAFSVTLFNRQSDLDYSPPTPSAGSGISGGHFDVDFYSTSSGSFAKIQHVHEYDDKYDVTGVNFLNASDSKLNLATKLATNVEFKVLVMNQYLNPASLLSVGGGAFVGIKDYGGLTTAATAGAALAGLPTYTLANVNTLAWKMPLDGFKSKDWWGDGGTVRAGLIPTQTGCVNKVNSNGSAADASNIGLNGERHDGAMTVQIIKSNTPDTALELNYSGGGAKYGWRVKADQFTTYVLAEYTTFWHHPNGKCYGQTGWVPNPSEDPDSGGKVSARALGSSDPTDGAFGVTPAGVTIASVATTIQGNTTTTVVNYSDGKRMTTVVTSNGDGTEQVTVTDRNGATTTGTRMSAGSAGRGPEEILQASRRINWREVLRP
jgi:Tfp pilus tip-associated adhesin PilY1